MAELNTGDGGGKKGSGKVRSKKQNSKVDLTAMVDLAFLLITFFMLTTTLSKPQSMKMLLPDKDPTNIATPPNIDENLTLTILLDGNDKVISYGGLFEKPIDGAPKTSDYGKGGIRQVLISKKAKVKDYATNVLDKPKQGIIVLIKPSKKSNYRNLVDILDEMAITKVETYAIVNEFTPEETKLLLVK
jgi:biopolymer transport protein ExbD